ncbi:serine/threonine protein kinase, putative [Perkinsus marinus ATCC 50983]|uniref:Serine/threonine protein kinase, putative n=1 Tax=Perkinsus marinus (strain ATCC 50983 / TXsc) TaxID=423536 RepID=C5KYD3_PERM5|nr:serine/threonine protein kinase, putative [Perkinsus marinus ATCC 50983]EER10510.1 serine/threonine protein kinase, putative [Perkinsus marinus ATCC 50983]|eukprot:XP_002778715.1 serine/threonine protein kinase, putative [Perkinsus marinus ATCC 50983]
MPSSSAAVTPVVEERISSLLETALSSVEAAKEFYAFVMSGEVRDETFSERVYKSLRNFMLALLSIKEPARYTDLVPLHYCRAALIAVLDCPECVYVALASHLDSAVLIALVKRCSGSASTEAKESMLVATVDMDTRKTDPIPSHGGDAWFVESLLHRLYEKCPSLRPQLRLLVGEELVAFVQCPQKNADIKPLVSLLGRIIGGFQTPLNSTHLSLLYNVILPLHMPNGFASWDRQTPLLKGYHRELTQCVVIYLDKQPELFPKIMDGVFTALPPPARGNTAKELLLLAEIARLLQGVSVDNFNKIDKQLRTVVKNRVRVNKMIANVLAELERVNPSAFQKAATATVQAAREAKRQSEKDEATRRAVEARLKGNRVPVPSAVPKPPSLAQMSSIGRSRGSGSQPPVTITGVAPWGPEPKARAPPKEDDVLDGDSDPVTVLHRFCENCEPHEGAQKEKVWEEALTAPSPTILTTLKFHQMVRAREIGSGAFSTVLLYLVTQKGKVRSEWPEYAVKVIHPDILAKYSQNISREIAILRLMPHPGITRLVSAFMYHNECYLVLEYAANGDMFDYLQAHPSGLSEGEAKRALGEVLAALDSIHQQGFVYVDMKPENIVITSTRHIKLTDFGGARPYTTQAEREVEKSRHAVQELRSGDWRYDGTFHNFQIYMAPELLRGRYPSVASDMWAYGVVMYQLLTGRPPEWADAAAESEIEDKYTMMMSIPKLNHSSLRIDLIKKLLNPNPDLRPTIEEVMSHPWFEGMNVGDLYLQPVPEGFFSPVEKAQTEVDSRWSKRQLSKVWSAQPNPQDYRFDQQPATNSAGIPTTPIVESEERGSPFLHAKTRGMPPVHPL